ncbi:adhesion G-protein coupled receptor G4 [Talpa occidentalis]|uniref:adhesion G-protein coupled receptor G4 n=1 Tax=Talpa occidentalis TaxID=50954 RepID=UPI00188F57FA|nr:adhesion G-protein coupled receptor G4 [Talpa occidentalis]
MTMATTAADIYRGFTVYRDAHTRAEVVMTASPFLVTRRDGLSLKGRRLDFYGRADTYVSLTSTVPELSRFTTCIDLAFTDDNPSDWMAFSYITNNTFLGREDIDLGLAGDHQQLILYKMGKIFYIHYHLTPLHWHTICLIWDGVKGKLELFLNKERILVIIDQPQNLAPNGTLILGHLLKKRDSQIKSVIPAFSGSLYYFQLWDHILEIEEFMKCLDGNIVSWEEDVWLINNLIPTVDTRLRCFVSEDITIQTTLSQQVDLTTPSQITGLKPEKTAYATAMSKSVPVFATDYTTISYFNTTSLFLKTTTTPILLKTSTTGTVTSAAGILSTSTAIALPTHSMKITKSPRTTKMAKTIATKIFHPTTMTNFLHTSRFTKNSIASKPSVTGSQSAAVKTTFLFSSKESSFKSTTSWPKHSSTDTGALPIPTTSQEFLASTAAGTVCCSMVEQTSATTTHIGATSVTSSELVLTSTAPGDSIFPRNQSASTLATTDKKVAFTAHPMTLPARPIEMTPALRTAETESTSVNFQDVSSHSLEDTVTTFMPEETSSMSLSFSTSSPFVRTQSVQTGIHADTTTTRATFAPGITLAPTVAETTLSLAITGLVSTENTPTGDENMLPLLSTISASISKVAGSGPTSVTDNGAQLFSTSENTWTSRPDQTLLTSAFHGSTSNSEHSSTTTHLITPAEAFTDSKATTAMDVTITADAAADRYTTVLSKLTSPWFANFSTVSETTSVTKLPECKRTTLLLKTTPMATVAEHELLSTPKETVVPPVDIISTLSDNELHFSTESASETTQTETRGTVAFGETTALAPESATQRFNTTVTKKETTSHYLNGKLTAAATSEIWPSATRMEATDEPAQVMTTSVPVSLFPDTENLSTSLDNAIATTEARGSWLSTKAMKTTSKSLYNGTTETFISTHTYTAHWTSETPPKGNLTPSPTSGNTRTFPEPLNASTAKLSGTSFATNPASRTAMSLSAGTSSPQPAATDSSATPWPVAHMSSLPVNNSAVTSVGASKETNFTMPEPSTLPRASSTSVLSDVSILSPATAHATLVPPSDQTSSITSKTVPTHRDSGGTTSEVTVISVRMTPTAVSSLAEASGPSLTPPTPMATKTETTLLSTSVDIVTPSTHTPAASKSLPVTTPVVSSTKVISHMPTPVATQPISQVEEMSAHAVSFPYTFSGGADVVSLATDTTETSVDENITSHSSANKLTTSVDGHISQSSTHLFSLPVPTLLETGISTLSSGKEQSVSSLGNTGNTLKTMKVTEASPSKNPFISNSHSTLLLEMTDTGFVETTTISSHQSHAPPEIPLVTSSNGISISSTTSGSTQITPTLTLSHKVDVHSSEEPTSLGKTAVPTHALTITTFSSPENESTWTLSVNTPRTEKMTISTNSTTHPVSYRQDTSFVDASTSRTNKISNPVNISPTVSHLLSPRTQPEVTSIASPISENKQTSSESLSPFTMGLSSVNFTMMSTDRPSTALSAQNVPTALVEKTSMITSIPTNQMSSLPVNVTVFTSKRVSDTPTIQMTKSSKTAQPDYLKSPFVATSGSTSETSSIPVSDSAFSPPADTSTPVGSFSTSLSSVAPKTTMTIQASTLDVIPGKYTGPSSKSTVVSSVFTTSEMRDVSSRIIPTSFSFPTEPTFPSLKTIPTTIVTGILTPFLDTTPSSLLSSKNTEVISSIPKSTFLSFLSTTEQSSQGDEATTLGILPGITNSSLSTVRSGGVTVLTNPYSRTVAPESALSSTPSSLLHSSLSTQVFPSLTSFKSTPGPTSLKATIYHSSNTEKMTSLSENTLTTELTKSATSVNTPVSYPPWNPSSATPSSLMSFLSSPRSTKAEFSTSKTLLPPTSQMAELPALGIRTTSSNAQSLYMTSWNTPTAKDSQFPISTTTHVPTPDKTETETPYSLPESLTTFTTSQTGLVSGDVMEMSSISSSGILSTLGMSENPSVSTSLRSIPTTLTDIKHTFEKTTIPKTLGLTLPLNPSGSLTSKTATSPMLAWLVSSLHSGSPLVTKSNTPHITTSSVVEVSKSTFLTSDMTATHLFTNFTTLPFPVSTILTKITPTSAVGGITTGFPASPSMSVRITDDSVYISKSPEASSRTTVTANSRTVSQTPSFGIMSESPPTIDHTSPIGSMPLTNPTTTPAWSRIPVASVSLTLALPKPTGDSLPKITTTTSMSTGTSFLRISTGVTHPSTATVSSLLSSSLPTWLDPRPSFLSTETLTSPVAAESTVSFYDIKMSFSVFDEESSILVTSVLEEFSENWLNSIFQDSEFALANLAVQIKSRCVCQVIIKANSSLPSTELISKIKSKIHGNFTQDQLTLSIRSEHVAVEKLEPGKCKADETASKYKGTYKWLLTNPTETAQTRCIKNEDGNATRTCSISIKSGKSQWEKPKFKQCKLLQGLPDRIMDLANITISDENAEEVAEHILNLINESPPLDKDEIKIIVSKVSDISYCDEISMNLTQTILQIISASLGEQHGSASELHEVSNEILRIIERVGHKMEFVGRSANLTVARLALAVLRVDHTFEGMAFSIRSYEEGTDPEIYLGDVPLERVLASIYLPKSLKKRIPLSNLRTILFNFFGQTSLFKVNNAMKALTTYVVSASISNMSIQNLADPVVVTLQHIGGNRSYGQVHCAFWDFGNNNGRGGWNSSGCKVKETNVNHTVCQCDHLTHFGVLMDLSRSGMDAVNERILTLITYTGCGISSIFLGVVMVTYIAFHKLRRDHPSKILINLCTALLMLNLVFLVNSWSSSLQKAGLCITAAVVLHYSLLVSITWMGLEAVHMYFALIKVFNIYIPHYMLKFCLVGWGIPAIIVTITLIVNKDVYGTLGSTKLFCWIKDDSAFYVSVVAYFCLIFLMNLSTFCTVLAQLNSMKSQNQKTRQKIIHDLRGTMSLTFLLGLTWGFAFFAWGPARILFSYLFAISNTLQGFFIFVFHCVMKESVREQWQIHLYCRWLRLDNSSDGNSRHGLNVVYQQERLKKTFQHKLLTPSLRSTATSSTFKTLGSAQGAPSEISFPNADFDEDPYCFSPLSCEVVPNCVRRILPVEIKINSIHKQRFLQ